MALGKRIPWILTEADIPIKNVPASFTISAEKLFSNNTHVFSNEEKMYKLDNKNQYLRLYSENAVKYAEFLEKHKKK